jgi:hypothetical protein
MPEIMKPETLDTGQLQLLALPVGARFRFGNPILYSKGSPDTV